MVGDYNATVIEAAGGVVECNIGGSRRIAVIYRERYGGEWGLPKGKRQAGESWQTAALREVEEEIGLRAAIIGVAGATAYLAYSRPKLVLYWHMRAPDDAPPFTPNDEATKLAWLAPSDAMLRLSHAEEIAVLESTFEKT